MGVSHTIPKLTLKPLRKITSKPSRKLTLKPLRKIIAKPLRKLTLKPPSLTPSMPKLSLKPSITKLKAIDTKTIFEATQTAFAEELSRSANALNEIIEESNDADITDATSVIVGSAHATSVIVGSELIPEVNEKH